MDYLTPWLGARTSLPSRRWGSLVVEVASFSPARDGDLVVTLGDPWSEPNPLVRIHSECVFAEVFDSRLCDCGDQLELAMDRIASSGSGLLVYLRFDGRGAGLAAKVCATALEVTGVDTYKSREMIGVAPEGRDYSSIGLYLLERGLQSIRLLTNNPDKVGDLRDAGLHVQRESLLVEDPAEAVASLYETKAQRFGHAIPSYLYAQASDSPNKHGGIGSPG